MASSSTASASSERAAGGAPAQAWPSVADPLPTPPAMPGGFPMGVSAQEPQQETQREPSETATAQPAAPPAAPAVPSPAMAPAPVAAPDVASTSLPVAAPAPAPASTAALAPAPSLAAAPALTASSATGGSASTSSPRAAASPLLPSAGTAAGPSASSDDPGARPTWYSSASRRPGHQQAATLRARLNSAPHAGAERGSLAPAAEIWGGSGGSPGPGEDGLPRPPVGLAKLRSGSSSSLSARYAAAAAQTSPRAAASPPLPSQFYSPGSRSPIAGAVALSSGLPASPVQPHAQLFHQHQQQPPSSPTAPVPYQPSLPDLFEAGAAASASGTTGRAGRSPILQTALVQLPGGGPARYHRPTASLGILPSTAALLGGSAASPAPAAAPASASASPSAASPLRAPQAASEQLQRAMQVQPPALVPASSPTHAPGHAKANSMSIAEDALAGVAPPRPPRPALSGLRSNSGAPDRPQSAAGASVARTPSDASARAAATRNAIAASIRTRRSLTLDEFMDPSPSSLAMPGGKRASTSTGTGSRSASRSTASGTPMVRVASSNDASQGFSSDSDDAHARSPRRATPSPIPPPRREGSGSGAAALAADSAAQQRTIRAKVSPVASASSGGAASADAGPATGRPPEAQPRKKEKGMMGRLRALASRKKAKEEPVAARALSPPASSPASRNSLVPAANSSAVPLPAAAPRATTPNPPAPASSAKPADADAASVSSRASVRSSLSSIHSFITRNGTRKAKRQSAPPAPLPPAPSMRAFSFPPAASDDGHGTVKARGAGAGAGGGDALLENGATMRATRQAKAAAARLSRQEQGDGSASPAPISALFREPSSHSLGAAPTETHSSDAEAQKGNAAESPRSDRRDSPLQPTQPIADRSSSAASSPRFASRRLGFRNSVFSSRDEQEDGISTPALEQAFGQAFSTDSEHSTDGPLSLEQVEEILQKRLAGRNALALDTRGIANEKTMGVVQSPTISQRSNSVDLGGPYGANFHIRSGSFRSVAPSIVAPSVVSSAYQPGPHEIEDRENHEQEENFWSSIGQSQFESVSTHSRATSYASASVELSLPAQLIRLSDQQKRALTHELAERQLQAELRTMHKYDDADAPLPMLRFLLDSQAGLDTFFRRAILPIAKACHAKRLSAYVDRHGEGDGTRFSATSTTALVQRFVVSILAHVCVWQLIGPADGLPRLDQSSMLFLPYRLPVPELRNGGFEVDVFPARAGAYMLVVRRPSRWDNYVFRTEQHFAILRKNLLKELGTRLAIPELPGSEGESQKPPVVSMTQSPRSVSSSASFSHARNGSTAGIDSDSDSGEEEGRPRSRAARRLQRAAVAGSAVKLQLAPAQLQKVSAKEGIAKWPSKTDMRSRPDSKRGQIGKPPPRAPSPPASVQSVKIQSKVNLGLADEGLTTERAARGQQLRSWLRATLAIRGVGHSQSMQAFLNTNKTPEHELKREREAVREALELQQSKAQERMLSAGRDALLAGVMQEEVFSLGRRLLQDELLVVPQHLRSCPSIAQLPRDYQASLKWIAAQGAHQLYGLFVAGDESHGNLSRAKELSKMMPWQDVSTAMRSPAFAMLKQVQHRFLQRRFVQGVLDLFLQDDPASIQVELKALRARIRSETIETKLRRFVEAPDAFKEMVRRSADEASVPLAVAIVRGSDEPRLNRPTLERVIAASKVYKEFMSARPNAVQKNSNNSREYRFVKDLQRMLRLYSLWRDGRQIRAMIADADVADAISELFQPFADLLGNLQQVSGSEAAVLQLGAWIQRLLDICDALRKKVQDPARSVAAITEHLESGFQSAYAFLHQVAVEAPELLPFSRLHALLQSIAQRAARFSFDGQDDPAPPSKGSPGDLVAMASSLDVLSRKHFLRAQEIFARWIAGDCEEESSIIVIGDMAGKTRREPFFPRELPAKPHLPQLDQLLPAFATAMQRALE